MCQFSKVIFQDACLTLAEDFRVSGFLAVTAWGTQCLGCMLCLSLSLNLLLSLFSPSATPFLLSSTRGIIGCADGLKWSEGARIGGLADLIHEVVQDF